MGVSFVEVMDLMMMEFFSAWAIVNGGVVFLSPFVTFSFLGSISGDKKWTFNFNAIVWVFL